MLVPPIRTAQGLQHIAPRRHPKHGSVPGATSRGLLRCRHERARWVTLCLDRRELDLSFFFFFFVVVVVVVVVVAVVDIIVIVIVIIVIIP